MALFVSAVRPSRARYADRPDVYLWQLKSAGIFGYDWDEITSLRSRLSAELPERGERQGFLDQVARDGFVTGYRGIRITKSGQRFWIEQATVWQLFDDSGVVRGQAAMIPQVAKF